MDDKWHCRTLMLLNFDFLANLYTSTNATVGKILLGANDLQIKLVIKILYFIVKKEIPLTKQCMKNMITTKSSLIIFKSFKEKKKVITLLRGSRSAQMKALRKASNHFPDLFFFLFNADENSKEKIEI